MTEDKLVSLLINNQYDKLLETLENTSKWYNCYKDLPLLIGAYLIFLPEKDLKRGIKLLINSNNVNTIIEVFQILNEWNYQEQLYANILDGNILFKNYYKHIDKYTTHEKQNIIINLHKQVSKSPLYIKLHESIYEFSFDVYIHNNYNIFEIANTEFSIKFIINIMSYFLNSNEIVSLLKDIPITHLHTIYMCCGPEAFAYKIFNKDIITDTLFQYVCCYGTNNLIRQFLLAGANPTKKTYRLIFNRKYINLSKEEFNIIFDYFQLIFGEKNFVRTKLKIHFDNRKTHYKRYKNAIYTKKYNILDIVNAFLENDFCPDQKDLIFSLKHKIFFKDVEKYNLQLNQKVAEVCEKYNYDPYNLLPKSYKYKDIDSLTDEEICNYKPLKQIETYFENKSPSVACIKILIEKNYIDLFISLLCKYDIKFNDDILTHLAMYCDRKKLCNVLKIYNQKITHDYKSVLKKVKNPKKNKPKFGQKITIMKNKKLLTINLI